MTTFGWKKGIVTYMKNVAKVLRQVSVEPAAFLMMTSILMSYLIFQNFILDRICRVDLSFGDEICDSISSLQGNHTTEEKSIQKLSATYRTYRSWLSHSFPILLVLLIGPWSDIYGRKLPMLLGISTCIISDVLMVICSFFPQIGGLALSILVSIPKFFSGSEMAFSLAAYSYISDTSDGSTRTVRIGLLSAGYSLGVPLGFASAALISKLNFGYPISFALATGASIIAFLIVMIRVENKSPQKDTAMTATSTEINEENGKASSKVLKMTKELAMGVFKVAFRKREGCKRFQMWTLIFVYACVAGPIQGEFGVMYLYLRTKLNWNSGDYGFFSLYNYFVHTAGVILSMGIFSHYLKLGDPIVGFLAGISQFVGCFMYAFAQTATVMYLACAADMMNGTMHVVAKSMLTKLIDADEYGKIFTLLALLSEIIHMASDTAYSNLYRFTLDTFPGAFFILSAVLTIPPQIIYGYFMTKDKLAGKRKYCTKSISGVEVETKQQNVAYVGGYDNQAKDITL